MLQTYTVSRILSYHCIWPYNYGDRRIAGGVPAILAERGRLLVEMGAGQAAQVSAILRAAGFKLDEAEAERRDLAGRPRVVAAGLSGGGFTGSHGQKKAWRSPMFRLGS